MIIPGRRALALALAALAACLGGGVALYYHRLGLTLSHYDARGHLIVARAGKPVVLEPMVFEKRVAAE